MICYILLVHFKSVVKNGHCACWYDTRHGASAPVTVKTFGVARAQHGDLSCLCFSSGGDVASDAAESGGSSKKATQRGSSPLTAACSLHHILWLYCFSFFCIFSSPSVAQEVSVCRRVVGDGRRFSLLSCHLCKVFVLLSALPSYTHLFFFSVLQSVKMFLIGVNQQTDKSKSK